MPKINNLKDLITISNKLANNGNAQKAMRLIDTVTLTGLDEDLLDNVFDKVEYDVDSTDHIGIIDEKYMANRPNRHIYIRDDGSRINKHDVFQITNMLSADLNKVLA